MTARSQVALSLTLVTAAVVAVAAISSRGDDMAPVDAGPAQSHDHAAMAAAAGSGSQPVSLDPESARRIGVTYATAETRPFSRSIVTVGNVTFDETQLAAVSAKVDGWIERLFIDFTGAAVRRGEPLLEIYSPALVAAQEELLLARRLADSAEVRGGVRSAASAQELLESARRRLRYWDIDESTIAAIEAGGEPRRTLTLRSPAGGIIVEKMALAGSRVMAGADLFRIADLSSVWIEGEVFEKDLSLVHLGQRAAVSFEAYPGESFAATVTWVSPIVSVEARTGRIRLEIANPGMRLKPGMYANVELTAGAGRTALLIPRSAVHFTGERAIVFIRGEDGMLMPREITTGLTAGADIEVLSGLLEGEVVVSSANFLIDAEANMGSSMAGMDGGASADTTAPPPAQDHSAHTGS